MGYSQENGWQAMNGVTGAIGKVREVTTLSDNPRPDLAAVDILPQGLEKAQIEELLRRGQHAKRIREQSQEDKREASASFRRAIRGWSNNRVG